MILRFNYEPLPFHASRKNKAVYTALGAPKHLYKRVNEKALRTDLWTDRQTDGRMDGQTDPLIEVLRRT